MWRAKKGRISRVLMVSFAAACTWASPSFGQEATERRAIHLEVQGSCPSRTMVSEELRPLLERWELSDFPNASENAVRVVDHGGSVEISAVGDTREVADPGRDCRERARVAAVFIALRLEPAAMPSEESRPEERQTRQPRSSVPSSPSRPLRLDLGFGALVERSIAAPLGWTAGPLLGLGLSKGGTLLHFSASVQSTSEVEARGVDLRFSRIPLDLGGGYSMRSGAWTLTPVLSVAADYLRVRALDLDDARAQGRLEVGPRASFRVERPWGGVRLFGAARLTWLPRDYIVEVEPIGEIQRTPRFWLGVAAGIQIPVTRR